MKSIKTSIAFAVAAGLLAFAPVGLRAEDAAATAEHKSHHEGGTPAAGELVKLTDNSIEIKDHKGASHTFAITAETKYGTKLKPAKKEDFKEGEHVLVNHVKEGDKIVATVIRELPPHHHKKAE